MLTTPPSTRRCVVVSAFAAETDQEEAREAGAAAFVSKPFDPDELSATVAGAPWPTIAETLVRAAPDRRIRRGVRARSPTNIDSAPIAARVLGAIGVLAVLVAVAFAVVLLAMSNLRGSTDEQVQANRVTASTLRLERVVDELEQSLRGFVLTRNARIRAELGPAPAASCRRRRRRSTKLVAAQPQQAQLAWHRRSGRSASTSTDYGEPLIAIALESPARGALAGRVAEGLTRIGQIRREPGDPARPRGPAGLGARLARARARANQAVLVGVVALAASGFLLLLVIGYLIRVGRTPGARRRERRGQDRRRRLLDPHPAGRPGRDPGADQRVQLDGRLGRAGRRDLERQNEQLRQSERAKSELITIVSHELRTPLSSILGYTSLILRRDTDGTPLRRYVEIIHDQGQRLDGLVEGFLSAEEGGGRGSSSIRSRSTSAALLRREVELARANTPDHELVGRRPGGGAPRSGRPRPAGAGVDQPGRERDQVLAGGRASSG